MEISRHFELPVLVGEEAPVANHRGKTHGTQEKVNQKLQKDMQKSERRLISIL